MSLNQTKRKSHKRSRKGCTRCKGRHVRCDEAVPICGNCFKYGHHCSLSETQHFEIDVMSANDFATLESDELEASHIAASYQTLQPQSLHHYPQPQQARNSRYSQHQSDRPLYTNSIPYLDPLRNDMAPEAVSALDCYLQVSAQSQLPAYWNQTAGTEDDPKYLSEIQPPRDAHSETSKWALKSSY